MNMIGPKISGKTYILGIGYLALVAFGIIYSYTQIDLNLTLSANPAYQLIQNQLIQIGYYRRGISTILFSILILGLSILYLAVLHLVRSYKIGRGGIVGIIMITSLLIMAYPAFSHDLFNYMFDARIAIYHNVSPEMFRALDFPSDPWTRFMHWTHRYYPYGPVWLWISIIPTLLGMGKFVFTLLLYKFMFLFFHVCNLLLLYKLLNRISKFQALWGVVLYGLNPLVLIESLLSPHNEVPMLTLVLFGIWLLLTKHIMFSVLTLILSAGIKFISIIILPITWIFSVYNSTFYKILFYIWLIGLIPLMLQREPYSWYFIPLVGLAALCLDSTIIPSFAISVSIALLTRYAPFLLTGEYTSATTFRENVLFAIVAVVVFLFITVFYNNYKTTNSTSIS